jgi:signal transduction histidine kinase
VSKKQILTRLDFLLTELEQGYESSPSGLVENNLGWLWECNAEGLITSCSPEVKYILGVSPDDFIGKNADTHRLTPDSASSMKYIFRNGNASKELILGYITNQGDIVQARTTIQPILGSPDKVIPNGWLGKVQVIAEAPIPKRTNPELPATLEPDTTPQRPAYATLQTERGKPQGYLADQDQLVPAQDILTDIGKESVRYQRSLYANAGKDEPATIAVPARLHDNSANLILEFVDSQAERHWSEDELALVEQVADQLTLALENAHLFKQTQLQAEELITLRQVSLELARQQHDLQSVMEIIIHRATELLDSDSAAIWLWDETENCLLLQSAFIAGDFYRDLSKLNLREELYQTAFQNQKTQVVSNYISWGESPHLSKTASPGPAIAVPLTWQTRGIGVLLVTRNEQDYPYTGNEKHLIELLAAQAAAVIQNAALFDQTQKALEETDLLYKASAELNASETYGDILNVLRSYTILGSQSSEVSINLYDRPWSTLDIPEWYDQIARWSIEDNLEQVSIRYELHTIPSHDKLLSPDSPTIIEDVNTNLRLSVSAREVFRTQFKAQALVFAPLITTGRWIGHLTALYPHPVRFYETAIRRLATLAGQAAIALQNLRLLEETRRRADELQTAAEIARDTTGTLSLEFLLRRTAELIRERFNYYHTAIYLLDENGEYAFPSASTNYSSSNLLLTSNKIKVGSNTVIGFVTQVGEHLLVNDVTQDPLHLPNPLLPETRAEVGIPLKIGDRVIGALDVLSARVNAFTQNDISVLQILADQIAVAVENARSYQISLEAMEEMRKADQLKSQFLANMSHELRTPLNSIIGFSRVILKGIDGPISETQEQDLQAIYGSGQHLLNLINDILDLSKIEAGKMELSLVDKLQVEDLIHSIMSTASGLVKDKPVEIFCEIAPKLPAVKADPLKIRQVLLNLISNAAKFTDQGSITIKAEAISGDNDDSYVMVSVVDTGHGIAIEDQKKLFLPFSQVDASPTRKTGGSGLGLSICRHLIEMHNGQIDVQSEVGQGSTFYFTIPTSNQPA